VALTFDADMTYHMRWLAGQGRLPAADAAPVLDALARHDVPATLFLTGLWAEMYPDRVRALAANPRYELASHTYSHGAFRLPCYGLSGVPPAARTEEIVRAGAVINSGAGRAPRLLRFPGGCYSPQDQALAEALGYRVIQWDVVSTDATSRSSEVIANAVLGGARNGSIIVLHMTGLPSTYTARALDRIIPGLRAQGFELVTVSDLFRPLPPLPAVRAVHTSAL
jgi:peptidoglycan/xylan/chitin deacetylase (PgdA/CDA1 family)